MKAVDSELKLISVLAFSLVFYTITFELVVSEKNLFRIHACMALRSLVLLSCHLVALCGRIVVTDRKTD